EDGTVVTIAGQSPLTLDRGQFHEFVLDDPAQVTANRPVLLMQFANGQMWDLNTDPSTNAPADPFMLLVPPAEQYLDGYTLTTPASGISSNFVNVVVPQDAVATVVLDGTAVPPESFTPIGTTGFYAGQLTVDLGSH